MKGKGTAGKSKVDDAIGFIKKGPKGKPIKLKRNTESLDELVRNLRVMCKQEYNHGENLFYIYDLAEKIIGLEHDNPKELIAKMLSRFYLVVRSVDPESYYVFTTPAQGRRLKPQIEKKE